MKKFFKVLLLAAVALMPVMGMAQEKPSEKDVEQKFEREMRLRQYTDSVERARLTQLYAHQEEMAHLKSNATIRKINAIWDDDILIMVCFIAAGITVLVLCLRHSRRKAEDHKELINKLIDNNLLNSTEPISKEAIEALMKPKKSDKDKFITDATLVGLGLGIGFGSGSVHNDLGDFLEAAATVLLFLGAIRLVIRTIFMIIGYFANKKRKSKIEAKEAEVVEEK